MDGFSPSAVPVEKQYLLEDQTEGLDNPQLSALVKAIRQRESGGDSRAVSPQGARGAMQIMPATFRQYAKPGESYENEVHRQAAAIRKLTDDFQFYGGDVAKTAAAYIGGRGAVMPDGTIRADVADAHGTSPRQYVDDILTSLGLQEPSAGPPAATKPTAAPPTWQEVTAMPEMQDLDGDTLEAARNQYFRDVVAPPSPHSAARRRSSRVRCRHPPRIRLPQSHPPQGHRKEHRGELRQACGRWRRQVAGSDLVAARSDDG